MQHNRLVRNITVLPALLALLLLQVACGIGAPAPTATVPPTPLPTDTPVPTATPAPTDTPVPTATPTQTPTITPDLKATASAQAKATADAQLALVEPTLKELGLTTEGGKMVWAKEDAITLEVTHYNSFYPELVVSDPVADFVLHTEVTWDSTSGLAGCGVIFRADDDLEQGGLIELDLMRLQNAPAWRMFYAKYNRIQSDMTKWVFRNVINDASNSTNILDLVVQGTQFQLYINGEKQRIAENNKQKEGGIALIAQQESGDTVCTYKNSWVWGLK
jgi:hypothetical protein